MRYIIILFVSSLLCHSLFAAKQKVLPYAPAEAIVLLKPSQNTLAAARSVKRFKPLSSLSRAGKGTFALVRGSLPTEALIEKLKNDPNVAAVFPNYRRKLFLKPNDAAFGRLWGLDNTGQSVNGSAGTPDADIDAPEAWEKTTGSRDYVVAVLDTGVDYTHEDLAANMWRNPGEIPDNGIDDDNNSYVDDYYGYDFAADTDGNNDGDPMDFLGHGSHVAGTIGGAGDNAKGVAGINWHVSIMALKVARPDGYLYDSDILEGIDYILQMKNSGVNIVAVNASYGGSGGSTGDPVNTAIDALGNAGIIFVAAAGNEDDDIDQNPAYPASYPSANIISVAATDQDDTLAGFSNTGSVSVDLAAPGTNIYSSLPGGDYLPKAGDIFFDDMESNDTLWVHGGTNDTWQITSEDAHGGSNAWSDSPGGDYVASSDSYLAVKDPIDLSGFDPATDHLYLGFWAKFQIEENLDNLWIELSKDGGTTWEKIDTKTDSFYSNTWSLYRYTIPPSYWSGSFMFRFHFTSDVSVEYNGVYLDDIGIGTANPSAYDYYNGTSMATPHVTGAVALIRSLYPNKTVAEIKSRILNNVDPLSSLLGKVVTGGRLNLNRAVTNHPPLTQDDTAATDINTSVTIDVLANDSDPDGDMLNIDALTTPPGHGNATIVGNEILYSPQSGYSGSDSFVYRVDDGSGGNSTAQVLVTIAAPTPNRPPIAADDTAKTQLNSAITIDVLANDSDPDGDTLTIVSLTQPAHGSASISGGTIVYTPQSGFSGTDTFSYTVGDGNGGSDTAQVTVRINQPPVAGDDTAKTQQDSSVTIDVLTNDSDPDGDTLTILSLTQPAYGSASISGGSIVYTPLSGFTGSDSFSYTVGDGNGGSDSAQVTITVEAKPSGGGGGFDLLSLLLGIAGLVLLSRLSLKKEGIE
ncbi:Ig-like domain-containing protein [Hydrogenimonas sp.]